MRAGLQRTAAGVACCLGWATLENALNCVHLSWVLCTCEQLSRQCNKEPLHHSCMTGITINPVPQQAQL